MIFLMHTRYETEGVLVLATHPDLGPVVARETNHDLEEGGDWGEPGRHHFLYLDGEMDTDDEAW